MVGFETLNLKMWVRVPLSHPEKKKTDMCCSFHVCAGKLFYPSFSEIFMSMPPKKLLRCDQCGSKSYIEMSLNCGTTEK